MLPPEDYSAYIDLGVRYGIRVVIPAILLGLLFGPVVGQLWVAGWFCYGLFLLLRWAVKEDRKEQERSLEDQSLWDDLKDIEKMITSSLPPIKKRRKPKPKAFSSEGEPMTCIMCGRYTNKGGRYCDEHDEEEKGG